MTVGYTKPLYILAFDHRESFKKLAGIRGEGSQEERGRVTDAKAMIFDGFRGAIARGAPQEACGILVDEEFGAEIARAAKAQGYLFAMPVEKSAQREFEFEYGEAFGEHIEAFDPTFAKVLVRYNPEGDREMNRRQTEKLRRLSDWLHARSRKFLFELLVPPEDHHLAAVGGDVARYDREIRPNLMLQAIRELQEAGVEPDVWKIEGIERREDCARIAAQVRAGGRTEVSCVVLGRGADEAAVVRWLEAGARVAGRLRVALGATIWPARVEGDLGGAVCRGAAAGAGGAR